MFDRLVYELKSLVKRHENSMQETVDAWVAAHAPRLHLVKWALSTDMFDHLTLTFRLPVEFPDQEGFHVWVGGVGWRDAALEWGVVSLLFSADAYDVSRAADGSAVLTLLHLQESHEPSRP